VCRPGAGPERWTFEEKLERYRALGVSELVVFHVDGAVGSRLRVWDRLDGDLGERVVESETTPCLTLNAFLVIAPFDDLPAARTTPTEASSFRRSKRRVIARRRRGRPPKTGSASSSVASQRHRTPLTGEVGELRVDELVDIST